MKTWKTNIIAGFAVAILFVILTTISASAAINSQINFQGKITNPDGTNISNGSYSIVFSLYNVGSAGTAIWAETNSVTVTDGIFQVNLGSSCPFLTANACNGNTPVDFNNSAIYMGIKVGADAEMTPRVTFTASPYAFNSDKVGGLTVSQLVQLSPGSQQTGSINVSGSITTASTLSVQGTNAITLGSTSNVGAILFQDGTSNNRLVTLNSPALTASYTLTLPTAAPGLSQCLQSGATTASQLAFGTCSAGAVDTLQQSYTASTGGTTPEIKLDSTRTGLDIQDADTAFTAGTALLSVRASNGAGLGTQLFVVNNSGTTILRGATTANDAAVVGADLFTASSFNAATGWTGISGTGTAATATHTAGGGTNQITTTFVPTAGAAYQVSFTIGSNSTTSNTVTVNLGGVNSPALGSNASHTVVITASAASALGFTPTTNFNGAVSGITVKLITNSTATLNLQDSTGTAKLEVRVGGTNNTFIGITSGQSNSSGSNNTATGTSALQGNITGNQNSAYGSLALRNNTTGSQNTANGASSLTANTTGGNNTAFGYGTLQLNTTGFSNTAIGSSALQQNSTGAYNTAIGNSTLGVNTTGNQNTGTGESVLFYNSTGSNNTSSGYQSLFSNTSGFGNTAGGGFAAYYNSTGGANTAGGYYSLFNLKTLTGSITATANNAGNARFTTGSTSGLVVGQTLTIAGTTNYNGVRTILSVDSATTFTISTAFNTADNTGTWTSNVNTSNNTATGAYSGQGASAGYTAQGNSLYGYQTGLALQSTADYNSIFGYNAGLAVTTGKNNTLFGYTAGNNLTTGSNNIIIGQAVAATAATSSNELNIGNVLFGNVDQTTATNRNIYVKSTNAAAFQVQNASGSEIFTVDSSANRVLFGKAGASGIDGKLVINNATNANTITIQTGVTSGTGYTLTLPTALGSSGDCLKDTNGSGVLGFASCTGATPTLQTGYTASTGGTTPEVKLDTTRTGFDIQDADTALTAGTALLSVRASSGAGLGTQLFSVDNSGATKISGGLTIGTVSTTSGSLAIANSLSAFKATIQSAQYAQDSTLTIPAAGATDTFCLQTLANCVGSLTLQQVYTASGATNPQILLGATGGALKIQDAASTVGTLFTVSSNGGGTTYLGVTTSGVNVSALNAGAGLIQTTGGLTATGSTSLNTTGTAATLIGNVSAPITMAASTLTATGALSFNTSGTAATLIGNVSAPVTIASSGINISSAGAISGATGYTQSSGNFAMSGSGTFATGTGAVNLNGATTITNANAAATSLTVNSGTTVPTADQVSISNASSTGVTTAGVNGLHVNYKGGAAAVESSGVIIDFAPGGTTGGTWSGLRIAANATGAAAGVTEYGIKLEGPTTPGSGTESAIYIGSGWDIGLDIQSGGLQMAAQNDPTTPTANNLRFYAKSIAGRVLPKWMGPSGVDTPVQANLGFNRISYMNPAGGTTLTTFVGGTGSLFTNTGTANNPTPASTNLLTSTRRATFSSGATAGTVASHRQSTLQVWRGNAANLGGFFYTIRFGAETLAAGNRAFVGLSDSTAAITNVDPITSTAPGKIGVAINANTGNWKWVNNVTGTAPTVVDLGASFPVNATDLYELIIYCPPNGSTITYRVTNLSTNSAGSAQVTGTATTNIPTNTTFLAPQFWITNNATAAAAMLAFGGWYLESDN